MGTVMCRAAPRTSRGFSLLTKYDFSINKAAVTLLYDGHPCVRDCGDVPACFPLSGGVLETVSSHGTAAEVKRTLSMAR